MDPIVKNILKHVCFRLVEVDDAEFILSLRTDPVKSHFISFTKNCIDSQKKWIEAYKEREKEGKEYYFVIEDYDSNRYGTLRLYDFNGDSFCWGSWIMRHDSPFYIAVESSIMVCELGFNTLGFCKAYGEIRKGNSSVLNYHLRCGAVIKAEDETKYCLAFTREQFEQVREKCARYYR